MPEKRELTEQDIEDLDELWDRDGPFTEERLWERAQREKLPVTRANVKAWFRADDRVNKDFTRKTWQGKAFTRARHSELKVDVLDMKPSGEFRHILVVQNPWSRKLYAEPLKTSTRQEVVKAMDEIWSKADPQQQTQNVVSDAGVEFTYTAFEQRRLHRELPPHPFAELVESKGAHQQIKNPVKLGGILATLDQAMGRLKYLIATRVRERNKPWPDVLSWAVDRYNNDTIRSIGASPNELEQPEARDAGDGDEEPEGNMADFHRHQQMETAMLSNDARQEAHFARIRRAGGFRPMIAQRLQETQRGPRRRLDDLIWGETEVLQTGKPFERGVVRSTTGQAFPSTLVVPSRAQEKPLSEETHMEAAFEASRLWLLSHGPQRDTDLFQWLSEDARWQPELSVIKAGAEKVLARYKKLVDHQNGWVTARSEGDFEGLPVDIRQQPRRNGKTFFIFLERHAYYDALVQADARLLEHLGKPGHRQMSPLAFLRRLQWMARNFPDEAAARAYVDNHILAERSEDPVRVPEETWDTRPRRPRPGLDPNAPEWEPPEPLPGLPAGMRPEPGAYRDSAGNVYPTAPGHRLPPWLIGESMSPEDREWAESSWEITRQLYEGERGVARRPKYSLPPGTFATIGGYVVDGKFVATDYQNPLPPWTSIQELEGVPEATLFGIMDMWNDLRWHYEGLGGISVIGNKLPQEPEPGRRPDPQPLEGWPDTIPPNPFSPREPNRGAGSGRGSNKAGWLLPERIPSNLEELRSVHIPNANFDGWEPFVVTLQTRPDWHKSRRALYPPANHWITRLFKRLLPDWLGAIGGPLQRHVDALIRYYPHKQTTSAAMVRHIEAIFGVVAA